MVSCPISPPEFATGDEAKRFISGVFVQTGQVFATFPTLRESNSYVVI
jgi:hypothetical protein